MAKRTQTKPVQQRKSGKGYEERDAEFGRLVVIGLGLLGVMVAGLLVAWGVFKYLEHSYKTPEFPLTFTVPDRLPPTPTLQANGTRRAARARRLRVDFVRMGGQQGGYHARTNPERHRDAS